MQLNWIILLVAVPMLAGIATTYLRGHAMAQRTVGIASLVACAGMSLMWLVALQPGGIFVQQVGGWEAPFGISVIFDSLSGLLILAANIVGLAAYIHSFGSLRPRTEKGWYHPLFHMLMMGVNFAFLTGDLFNMFVAFEIMLMSSYALLCISATREQLAQTYKYVILNLIGSTFFVFGAGLMYGMMGTLNYADLARLVAESQIGGAPLPTGFFAVSVMLVFVFALKAAVFPLWFWLPDTYHTSPIAVCALFSGLLTKVGIYAMCRLYPMIFAAPGVRDMSDNWLPMVLAYGAGATMLLGILAALPLTNIRRILACTLVSHMGYLIFGIVLLTDASMSGTLFYMAQHMLVMTALFLCCGLIEIKAGTDDLSKIGGLCKGSPWLGALFMISAMSLVGLPPFSGFYGKVLILGEGVRIGGVGNWVLTGIGLLTGVLTLVVMAKVWALAFWSPPRSTRSSQSFPSARLLAAQTRPGYIAVILLVSVSLAMGLGAGPALKITDGATTDLSRPSVYVNAVFQRAIFPLPEPALAQADGGEGARVEAGETAADKAHEEGRR